VDGVPAATGAALGALFAALNRFGMRRFWAAPRAPLNVVVTGGTRGIGKAVAREFLLCVPRRQKAPECPAACFSALPHEPKQGRTRAQAKVQIRYLLMWAMGLNECASASV